MVARYLPALMEVKPAVTLAVGGFLVGFHFRLVGSIPYLYGRNIQEVCLMPGAILYDVELLRFVTGVITHLSDYHLYWALASLAAKGLALEPRIGSKNFGTLLLALTVLTSVVTVVLSFSLYNLLGDHGWMKNCYLGELAWRLRRSALYLVHSATRPTCLTAIYCEDRLDCLAVRCRDLPGSLWPEACLTSSRRTRTDFIFWFHDAVRARCLV